MGRRVHGRAPGELDLVSGIDQVERRAEAPLPAEHGVHHQLGVVEIRLVGPGRGPEVPQGGDLRQVPRHRPGRVDAAALVRGHGSLGSRIVDVWSGAADWTDRGVGEYEATATRYLADGAARNERLLFVADVTTNGPGVVNWRWEISSGEVTEPQIMNFEEAGTQTLTKSFVIPSPNDYWVRLHVNAPNDISDETNFVANCTP